MAVHLELVRSLNVDQFLLAFHRYFCTAWQFLHVFHFFLYFKYTNNLALRFIFAQSLTAHTDMKSTKKGLQMHGQIEWYNARQLAQQ